jgi:hypothetical protein
MWRQKEKCTSLENEERKMNMHAVEPCHTSSNRLAFNYSVRPTSTGVSTSPASADSIPNKLTSASKWVK